MKRGGGNVVPAWSATKRTVKLPDGSTRVVYRNLAFPGELRIRKMRKGANGKTHAGYVKF